MDIFSWRQIKKIANKESPPQSLFAGGVAFSIGSFDGPHLGHKRLFDSVKKQALLTPGILTFTKSLRGYKDPLSYCGDIASLKQRLQFFKEKGFAFVILIDFNYDFCTIEGKDFFDILCRACNLKYLAEGQDFSCGHKGACNTQKIKEFSSDMGFCLCIEDCLEYNGQKISSSRIRECLKQNDFEVAKTMLGKPFIFDATSLKWTITGQNSIQAQKSGVQFLPQVHAQNVKLHFQDSKTIDAVASSCGAKIQIQCQQKIKEQEISGIEF